MARSRTVKVFKLWGRHRCTERASLGRLSERLARLHFLVRGYQIHSKNRFVKWGEIDFIAERGEERLLIEVRSRAKGKFRPELVLSYAKQRTLRRLAEARIGGRITGMRLVVLDWSGVPWPRVMGTLFPWIGLRRLRWWNLP